MTGKILAFVAVIAAIILIIIFLPGGEEPSVRDIPPSDRTTPPMTEQAAPAPVEAPPIDSLHITVQDSAQNELARLTIAPDEVVDLPGQPYQLRMTEFYTHFQMTDDGPVNVSVHTNNVAARIEILRNGQLVDYTWAFERVPFFRMGGMTSGDTEITENTGLAFAVTGYDGYVDPHNH